MKKTVVLFVIIILQTLFCSSYACDLKIDSQSNASQLVSKSSSDLSTPSIQNEHCHEKSNTTEHKECTQCGSCYHLFVLFFETKINFQAYDFFTLPTIDHFTYQQPFLIFSQKPPIEA